MKKKKHQAKHHNKVVAAKSRLPVFIIFTGAALVLLLLLFDPKTFSGGDNAHYMSLAYSILHGSYRVEAFIAAPPEIGVTPGYPVILALFLLIFGKTFVPAKILSLLCYLATFWLWWRLFVKQGYEKRLVLLFLGFCVLNPIVAEFSHWELTEAPFMLMSTIAFFSYFYALDRNDVKYWILTGILAAGAFYIRAAGLTVSLAIGMTLLTHKKWRPFLYFLVPVVVLLVPWFIRVLCTATEVGGGTYLPQFFSQASGGTSSANGFLGKFFRNFNRYTFVNLPMLFLPIAERIFLTNTTAGYLIGGSLGVVTFIGFIKLVRSSQRLYALYVFLFMIVLYSYNEEAAITRYLVVIAPFIALLLFQGIEHMCRALKIKRSSLGAVTVMGFFLVLSLPVYLQKIGQNVTMLSKFLGGDRYAGYAVNFTRFIEANEWITEHDKTNAGVISRKPRLTWWFSGHPAHEYKKDRNPQVVKADIDSSGAKYVIVDRISATTPQFLIPALQRYPETFKIIHVTRPPETYVLEIIR